MGENQRLSVRNNGDTSFSVITRLPMGPNPPAPFPTKEGGEEAYSPLLVGEGPGERYGGETCST